MNMVKNPSVRRMILEGKGGVSRFAIDAFDRLLAIKKDLTEKEQPKSYISKVMADGNKILRTELKNRITVEKARILMEIDRVADLWRKDYDREATKHRNEVQDAERRFNAMSTQELHEEILKWTEGGWKEIDPRIIDALSIAVKENDPTDFAILREVALKNRYTEPWLHTEEGKELLWEAETLESCKSGEFPVLITEEGKAVWVVMELEDLDETSLEEEEA